MKSITRSPESVKSNNPTTPTTMEETQIQTQSYYFPGCRKDANCSCKMCLESINATLDLMPMSVQKSSLTRLSEVKPAIEKTPISIDSSLLSTPVSTTPKPKPKPRQKPRKKVDVRSPWVGNGERGVEKKKLGSGFGLWKWILVFGLVFLGVEFGVSYGVLKGLRPRLSGEIVRGVVDMTWDVESLSERLVLVRDGLEGFVDGEVSSCNLGDSSWKINQDGLILFSHCALYRSAAEEVIIWGWPLQTAGLLTAGFSSRSFTLLSGRATEWPEGSIVSVVRGTNATWVQRKWSASAVQFESNTWIIEYKLNMFLENPSISLAAYEFFKFRISRTLRRMKQQFWVSRSQRNHCTASISQAGLSIPT